MTGAGFEHVDLEDEQRQLFLEIVEEYRQGPRDRGEFWFSKELAGSLLQHMGTDRTWPGVPEFDLEVLVQNGLLAKRYGSGRSRTPIYNVTPRALKYYAWVHEQTAEPVVQVEEAIRALVDSEWFTSRFPAAHAKWAAAVKLLWSPDVERHLSQIGHACREAMQEFADELATRAGMADAIDEDKQHTVARVKAVVAAKGPAGTRSTFNAALVAYWGELSDQVMRQEHAGQKEGEPIGWEDARRVVFHTIVVMYEISRIIDR